MQTYQDLVQELRDQLNKACGSLVRDVAAAVTGAEWHKFLRDKYDVAALVDRVAELGRQPEWVAKLQAAGDHARAHGNQRGRPRKKNGTGPAKPASEAGADAGG